MIHTQNNMFCSQKLFKGEMKKSITLLNIYFFIKEQIELFGYTFLRNEVVQASRDERELQTGMKRMTERLKCSSLSIQIKENYIF